MASCGILLLALVHLLLLNVHLRRSKCSYRSATHVHLRAVSVRVQRKGDLPLVYVTSDALNIYSCTVHAVNDFDIPSEWTLMSWMAKEDNTRIRNSYSHLRSHAGIAFSFRRYSAPRHRDIGGGSH